MPLRRAKNFALKILPWLITAVALEIAFRGIDWSELGSKLRTARPSWVVIAFVLTATSYLLRSCRWRSLFPVSADESTHPLSFFDSVRVLILGFFMNNVLPARTGELVRAHLGSRVTSQTRTLVLGTIASERLADGVTLSVLFVAFALGIGDHERSSNLLVVALLFIAAVIGVFTMLALRSHIIERCERFLHDKPNSRGHLVLRKLELFLEGLSPLTSRHSAPAVVCWSLIIWTVELLVYVSVAQAYSAELSLGQCVLFLVAVNFSSLIPAAPGGIGTIEAIASKVLVSSGVDQELAICMVLTQHAIQYLVIGAPGAYLMLSWKSRLPVSELQHE